MNALMRNWVFVRIDTDQPGLVGWGEASLEWKTRAVVGAVEDFAELLIGEDPTRTEHLWQVLYRQRFFKSGIVAMSALSGIDQALHDISARDLGVPLYRLLGGSVRDRARLYDHLGGGESAAVYGSMSEARFAELALASVERGFDALKILAIPPGPILDGHRSLRLAVDLLGAVRSAVGDDVEIMVDFHGRTSPAMAIQYGHALAPLRPWFVEEPCQPENVDAMARISRALPIPIATGERLATRFGFRELLEKHACEIIQPDVCHCGGISELKRIASMAEVYSVAVAPHNPLGPIATMFNLHAAFSMPNFLIQEVMTSDVPWRDELVGGPPVIEGGYAALPAGVGIGIGIDERVAAQHPYKPEAAVRAFSPDGSVADW